MSEMNAGKPSLDRFRTVQRKTVRLSAESLVRYGALDGHPEFPLLVEPAAEHVNLESWIAAQKQEVEERLLRHGVILFRGFNVHTAEAFQDVARALSGELLDYKERAAPRVEVSKGVYTSTEFPPDQPIPMHHEMSYSHNWPTKIWFYCAQAAPEGGATPVADDRQVIHRLDPAVKETFLAKGVMYVRNYGEGVDLPWQEAFQTTDRAAVEDYCRKAGATAEWRDRDRLRTRGVRQVLATHPKTGDTVWFNHAHLFHVSNLQPEVRAALLSEFADDELPRNAFYGDGTPIESATLDHIRNTYEESAVRFRWQEGDLMLVDNFLASHGREPFRGPRKILVAMAELYTHEVAA